MTEPPLPEHGAALGRPTPISEKHSIQHFDCGKPALNDWLKNRALQSESKSARTYVVCKETIVAGYYCLAAGGVLREETPKKIRHNLPTSVPIMVLGRLAVDAACQGQRIGSSLLKDAMQRTIEVSKIAGVRCMLVHAIEDESVSFYLQYGFAQFPEGSKTLFLPVETMIQTLAS